MAKFYLRIECVNLKNFVYDTPHLSTVRGGGLLLLDAPGEVEAHLRDEMNGALKDKLLMVLSITTGASSGLFEIEVADADADTLAGEVCKEAQRFFNDNIHYRHATTVVDVLRATEERDFAEERATLLTLNRWQQMQAPHVSIPKPNAKTSVGGEPSDACEIDLVRPATDLLPKAKGEPDYRVSEATMARADYGRDMKKEEFFTKRGVLTKHLFVRDLDELTVLHGESKRSEAALKAAHSTASSASIKDAKSNTHVLHHKMAVIYLDGNGFGKLQDELCKTVGDQKKFDDLIRKRRVEGWLRPFVEKMDDTKEGWLYADEKANLRYRLEILQWGGDETCWVVPAWKGWETLEFLFSQTRNWEYEGHMLTHAAGIVFCHHNAPIGRITGLAHDLAGLAKERGRDRNHFAYEVLESFDHIGHNDLRRYRAERAPQPATPDIKPDPYALLLPGDTMGGVDALMKILKEAIPRRKLVDLAHALRTKPEAQNSKKAATNGASPRATPHEKAACLVDDITRALKTDKKAWDALTNLTSCFGNERASWLHIEDLWDYLGLKVATSASSMELS